MSWFSKKQEPQPKDEPEEHSPVQESLDRLNHLNDDVMSRIKHGARWADDSKVILEWEATQEQRKLLHEYGVIPVVDQKTGKWKLFH